MQSDHVKLGNAAALQADVRSFPDRDLTERAKNQNKKQKKKEVVYNHSTKHVDDDCHNIRQRPKATISAGTRSLSHTLIQNVQENASG